MHAQIIRMDGVDIATETFGDKTHAPIVLIMGGMASMLWWPEAFCRRLAASGRKAALKGDAGTHFRAVRHEGRRLSRARRQAAPPAAHLQPQR